MTAYGTRYLKPGFSFSDEEDLRFALGWPHLRDLVELTIDDETAARDARALLDIAEPWQAPGITPRAVALRFVRAWSQDAKHAARWASERGEPLALDEAREILARALARRSSASGLASEHAVLLLEALLGPEPMLTAFADAIEALPEKEAAARPYERTVLVAAAGFALLRVEADAHAPLTARLAALRDALPEGAVRDQLDVVLDGATAARRVYGNAVHGYLHAHDAANDILRTARLGDLVADARLVFLAGEALLGVWASRWIGLREADAQRHLVGQLAPIRSAAAIRLLARMVFSSKVKDDATRALAAHEAFARAALANLEHAGGRDAAAAQAALRALDAAPA